MRNIIKRFRTAITLSCIACLILCTAGFKACPKSEKDKAVAYARDINAGFIAAAPIIAKKSAGLAAKWITATQKTAQMIDAVAASNATEVTALLRDIMPVFNEVVTSLWANTDVQIALAFAQIGLNFFVNHFLTAAKSLIGDPVIQEIIERFKALPQFGCQLHPERCR